MIITINPRTVKSARQINYMKEAKKYYEMPLQPKDLIEGNLDYIEPHLYTVPRTAPEVLVFWAKKIKDWMKK